MEPDRKSWLDAFGSLFEAFSADTTAALFAVLMLVTAAIAAFAVRVQGQLNDKGEREIDRMERMLLVRADEIEARVRDEEKRSAQHGRMVTSLERTAGEIEGMARALSENNRRMSSVEILLKLQAPSSIPPSSANGSE